MRGLEKYNISRHCLTYTIPIFIFLSLVASYFDYIICFSVFRLILHSKQYVYSSVCILMGSLLFLLLIISYVKVVLIKAGSPSENWFKNGDCVIRTIERDKDNQVRFCSKCNNFKPDRTHHCSSCNVCVLKMDHHCGVVNNCVGFYNYKFFVLFLFYLSISGIFVFSTMYEVYYDLVVAFNNQFSINVVDIILFPLGFMGFFVGLSMLLFCVFHLILICKNQTTIEEVEKNFWREGKRNFYNKGIIKNVKSSLGNYFLLWFIPVHYGIDGDGFFFSDGPKYRVNKGNLGIKENSRE